LAAQRVSERRPEPPEPRRILIRKLGVEPCTAQSDAEAGIYFGSLLNAANVGVAVQQVVLDWPRTEVCERLLAVRSTVRQLNDQVERIEQRIAAGRIAVRDVVNCFIRPKEVSGSRVVLAYMGQLVVPPVRAG